MQKPFSDAFHSILLNVRWEKNRACLHKVSILHINEIETFFCVLGKTYLQHIKILQIIDYLPPTLAEISLTVQSNRGNKIYVSQNLTCDTTTLMWIYKISRVDGKLTSFPPYGKPEQRVYKNFKHLRLIAAVNKCDRKLRTDTHTRV